MKRPKFHALRMIIFASYIYIIAGGYYRRHHLPAALDDMSSADLS